MILAFNGGKITTRLARNNTRNQQNSKEKQVRKNQPKGWFFVLPFQFEIT